MWKQRGVVDGQKGLTPVNNKQCWLRPHSSPELHAVSTPHVFVNTSHTIPTIPP